MVYFRLEKPDWINIERQAVLSHTIDFLLWCPMKSRPSILSPALSQSFKLWDTLKHLPALTSVIRPLDHIFHNPRFGPGMDIKSFQWWLDKGMYRIGQFFTPCGPITLKHCNEKLELPGSERFSFLQISHFLSSLKKGYANPLEFTQYERWCSQALDIKGGYISHIRITFRTHHQIFLHGGVGEGSAGDMEPGGVAQEGN